MYTCPTDDIHSIYLDGELPDIYLKEYEAHVKTCSECAKKLQKLQKLRSLFKSDSEMLTPDKIAMDESFKRLNTKLHYSKNTTYVYKVSKNAVFGSIAAAAAAAQERFAQPACRNQVSDRDIESAARTMMSHVKEGENVCVAVRQDVQRAAQRYSR